MLEPRYLEQAIRDDAIARGKMAFVSGPRQVGKTTLAKSLVTSKNNYHSWDDEDFRRAWSRSPRAALAKAERGPVALDEVHKDRRWKSRLKGVFDSDGAGDGLVVTGSARLDLYRRGGDSLMGRYLPYRLHPFTVAERSLPPSPDEILGATKPRFGFDELLRLGGFPEPLFAGSERLAKRWSRLRIERLIAEDVRDIRSVADLSGLRVLADLLPERVGSLLSVNALREDLGVAHGTVTSWLESFAALYHCFTLRPYSRRIARAVRTAPKLYLFDVLRIPPSDAGRRRENLVALHLLKACDYWTDVAHGEFELRFARDKEGREVDFVILRDNAPWLLVECRSSDAEPAPALLRLREAMGRPRAYQLVARRGYDREYPVLGVRVMDYERFLAGWV